MRGGPRSGFSIHGTPCLAGSNFIAGPYLGDQGSCFRKSYGAGVAEVVSAAAMPCRSDLARYRLRHAPRLAKVSAHLYCCFGMLASGIPPPLRQAQQRLQPLLHMRVASCVPCQLSKLTHS